jgi:DNA-binding response OmpR family regulator
MPVQTRRLLVVDDDEGIRAMLEMALSMEGFEVHVAADGEQALTVAATLLPDLIVLDVMMPRLGGHEVLKELRRSPPTSGTPVIMATALSGDEATWEGLVASADGYIRKPYDLAVLIDEIDRIDRGRPALPT